MIRLLFSLVVWALLLCGCFQQSHFQHDAITKCIKYETIPAFKILNGSLTFKDVSFGNSTVFMRTYNSFNQSHVCLYDLGCCTLDSSNSCESSLNKTVCVEEKIVGYMVTDLETGAKFNETSG